MKRYNEILQEHTMLPSEVRKKNCVVAYKNVKILDDIIKRLNDVIDDCKQKKDDSCVQEGYKYLEKRKADREVWRKRRDTFCLGADPKQLSKTISIKR